MVKTTDKTVTDSERTDASAQLYVQENAGEDVLQFLEKQLFRILSLSPVRPWYFWELHNPWGLSAPVVNSWEFLDICQDDHFTSLAAQFIGDDVILYDSQFHPDPATCRRHDIGGWQCDAGTCPASPHAGVVVRIILANPAPRTAVLRLQNSPPATSTRDITLSRGRVIAHDLHSRYCYPGTPPGKNPFEYVMRYFPATSKYIRRQHGDFHTRMNIRYPLQNFAARPLWLVRGEDRAENDFVTGFMSRPGQWI